MSELTTIFLLDWLQAANDSEPPANPNAWRELAQAYHAHHFTCSACIAAGRGAAYGLRCGVGAALIDEKVNKSKRCGALARLSIIENNRKNSRAFRLKNNQN